MNKPASFLSILDLSLGELGEVLELAARLKGGRGRMDFRPLEGQTWALLFHKSSTRTRVSFEVGIHELGGHAMILDQKRMQTDRGETVEDTARVLDRYLHGLIIRTFEHSIVERFARAGNIPVVNGLTDSLHPCQVLSDLLTLAERWCPPGARLGDALNGRKLAFYGDCASNMAHSWILGGALAGMEIVLCGPESFAPHAFIEQRLAEAGLSPTHRFVPDPEEAARLADVVYTDVWVSMGTEDEQMKRLALLAPYQVDARVMGLARPEAFFLHCLPAHPGEEVSREVYESPQSIVFDQAENRLHAQKAILSHLVNS